MLARIAALRTENAELRCAQRQREQPAAVAAAAVAAATAAAPAAASLAVLPVSSPEPVLEPVPVSSDATPEPVPDSVAEPDPGPMPDSSKCVPKQLRPNPSPMCADPGFVSHWYVHSAAVWWIRRVCVEVRADRARSSPTLDV